VHDFTPFSALAGGSLIGLGASLLMLSHGKVAGISGIFSGALARGADDWGTHLWFLCGLLLAGVVARIVHPSALPLATSGTATLAVGGVAGLLVGLGTRLGSGCTSGHGVCGLSRLSKRSLVATITFMATAMITVAVVRALGGHS
jgi:uncharacterized membrane protein YedE/YeeE